MPATLSYPGVYIEEISSGVRTITGVATSITAFIGRAAKGPTDADVDGPVVINSYGDYERTFGALDPTYAMGYAVRDFYLNGGAQAIIVRLYKGAATTAKAKIGLTNLPLEAASAGTWGNQLRVRIDNHVSSDVATLYGLAAADLFNLTVRDMVSGKQESFLNLSVKESPRRVDRVLSANSSLLRVSASLTLPATTGPAPMSDTIPTGKTVWDQDSTSAPVDGQAADSAALDAAAYQGDEDAKTGMYALKKVDLFNLLCIPADLRGGTTSVTVYQDAMALCVDRRALLIVDAPATWTSAGAITATNNKLLTDLGLSGPAARNAAVFFPA